MENWEKLNQNHEEVLEEMCGEIVRIFNYNDGDIDPYDIVSRIRGLNPYINSLLELAKQEERERIGGIITPILERHKNWKPAFRGESEEECGFQKGLIDEARLLSQDILDSLHQNNNEQGGK